MIIFNEQQCARYITPDNYLDCACKMCREKTALKIQHAHFGSLQYPSICSKPFEESNMIIQVAYKLKVIKLDRLLVGCYVPLELANADLLPSRVWIVGEWKDAIKDAIKGKG